MLKNNINLLKKIIPNIKPTESVDVNKVDSSDEINTIKITGNKHIKTKKYMKN